MIHCKLVPLSFCNIHHLIHIDHLVDERLFDLNFEKLKIKSPKTPKQGIFSSLTLAKCFARLLSTIEYKIIEAGFLSLEIILPI